MEASIFFGDLLIYGYGSYVLHFLHMAHGNPVISLIVRRSYEVHILDHRPPTLPVCFTLLLKVLMKCETVFNTSNWKKYTKRESQTC